MKLLKGCLIIYFLTSFIMISHAASPQICSCNLDVSVQSLSLNGPPLKTTFRDYGKTLDEAKAQTQASCKSVNPSYPSLIECYGMPECSCENISETYNDICNKLKLITFGITLELAQNILGNQYPLVKDPQEVMAYKKQFIRSQSGFKIKAQDPQIKMFYKATIKDGENVYSIILGVDSNDVVKVIGSSGIGICL